MKTTAFCVLLLALAASAPAQTRERKGFLIGTSIGLGNSSPDQCLGCDTGLAFDLRVGVMLKPRLGLLAWGGTVATAADILSAFTSAHTGGFAALQYWPSERFWLRAGGGVADVSRAGPGFDYSTTHAAGIFGVGFEINPRNKVVVELALQDLLSGNSPARFAAEPAQKSTVNSLMFTVGATFYSRR